MNFEVVAYKALEKLPRDPKFVWGILSRALWDAAIGIT